MSEEINSEIKSRMHPCFSVSRLGDFSSTFSWQKLTQYHIARLLILHDCSSFYNRRCSIGDPTMSDNDSKTHDSSFMTPTLALYPWSTTHRRCKTCKHKTQLSRWTCINLSCKRNTQSQDGSISRELSHQSGYVYAHHSSYGPKPEWLDDGQELPKPTIAYGKPRERIPRYIDGSDPEKVSMILIDGYAAKVSVPRCCKYTSWRIP